LKFNIGDLNVGASRENLEYSKDTKEKIIEKLKLAKGELHKMFEHEVSKIKTVKDYLSLRENFGKITIDAENDLRIDFSRYIEKRNLRFVKYPSIIVPSIEALTNLIIDTKDVGKKKRGNYKPVWGGNLSNVNEFSNIYLINEGDKKRKKTQSYLKHIHEVYHLVFPKNLDGDVLKMIPETLNKNFNPDSLKVAELSANQLRQTVQLLREFSKLYIPSIKTYNDVVVPADYKMGKQLDPNIYNRTITVCNVDIDRNYKRRLSMELRELLKFKGLVIYAGLDNLDALRHAGTDLQTLGYMKDQKGSGFLGGYETIKFIGLSKTNLKYMESFKNVMPVEDVFKKLIFKKRELAIKFQCADKFVIAYNKLSSLLKTRTFRSYDRKLGTHFALLDKEFARVKKYSDKFLYTTDQQFKIKKTDIKSGFEKSFDYVNSQTEKNPLVKYLTLSDYRDETNNPEVLKLINLVYVK